VITHPCKSHHLREYTVHDLIGYYSKLNLTGLISHILLYCTAVASLPKGHWGTCPLEFCKCCAFCSCCQLNCTILKITKEEYLIHFRRFARNTHKQIKTVSKPKRNPGQRRRGKIHVEPPHLISWLRHCCIVFLNL